eukprot:TRINITY_DN20853_c0_g1_i1.p1 TRINITY_DN20853_c0_g1~~TRINITY_DN20853_c0_g1_i1.p1  ORF type:complete len:486 (+),score=166.67 TRINITY_DN20853_c0_g1_i1:128-1459(+)
MPEEDEFGRPTCVPQGLSVAELMPLAEHDYWGTNFDKTEAAMMYDEPGNRALPKRARKEGEAMFNTNPKGEFRIDDDLVNKATVFRNVNSDVIEVPVYNLQKQVVGTRKLDSYIFGTSPETDMLFQAWKYELQVARGYGGFRSFNRAIAPGPHANHRQRQRSQSDQGRTWYKNDKDREQISGAARYTTEWRDKRVDASVEKQSEFLRQALSLKLNKERLIIVEDFNFPTESVDLLRDWTNSWGFDRDRMMAYIVDGGSAMLPTQEVGSNVRWSSVFTYGLKVAPPREMTSLDVMRHHYCVLTEGTLKQLSELFNEEKASRIPPHLMRKIHVPLAELGETDEQPFVTVEDETGYEMAQMEKEQYAAEDGQRWYQDPWLNGKEWDANEKRINAHRKMVSEHLPRLGEPIGHDIRSYWQGEKTRLPTGQTQEPEYMYPPINNRDIW